jgi:hypothetical protein
MGKPIKMLRKWQAIATAPANAELELSFYEKGQHHALTFPCRRDGSGWRDVRTNRSVEVTPTHWRLWDHTSA